MHNVEDKDIFRSSAWNAFGTKDREGADYPRLRPCKNFGPSDGRK
jgi:L-fucose isomerase